MRERRNLIDPRDDVRDVTSKNQGAPSLVAVQDRLTRLERELSRVTAENAALKQRVSTLEKSAG